MSAKLQYSLKIICNAVTILTDYQIFQFDKYHTAAINLNIGEPHSISVSLLILLALSVDPGKPEDFELINISLVSYWYAEYSDGGYFPITKNLNYKCF